MSASGSESGRQNETNNKSRNGSKRKRMSKAKNKNRNESKSSSLQRMAGAQVIAEFKSASALKRVKLGCDETRKNFARSELNIS